MYLLNLNSFLFFHSFILFFLKNVMIWMEPSRLIFTCRPPFRHGSLFLYLFLQIIFLARCHYPSGPRVTFLVAIRNQPRFLKLQEEWDRKGGCREVRQKRWLQEREILGEAVERVRGFSGSFEKDFLAEHPRNMKQWVGSLKYSAEKGISRYVYQSSISFIDIWMLSDLFGVDVKGHLLVCWDITTCLCLLLWI